ncbi:MAG: NUDIX domain-containing protein [Microbacteriaceae bacterium]|nr:NUDIX domain-containing protein [Microbacteriaceae bacterium]
MTHGFRVVPASYVFFRRDQDVLLQLRDGTGFMDGHWAAAAAGHVEEGESALDAACREAREELGVAIDASKLTPLTAMHRTQRSKLAVGERVDFFFECWDWEGEARLIETDKAADLGWFSLNALPHPVVPHEEFVLHGLRAANLAPVVTFGF